MGFVSVSSAAIGSWNGHHSFYPEGCSVSYFGNVSKIQFEGRQSTNPLSFKYYNPDQVVLGKSMREHLRFAVAYWHAFTGSGSDPFGAGTAIRDWDKFSGMDLAKARVEACFELLNILDVDYFAFHDRDIAPEGDTPQETNKNLDAIVALIKDNMKASGKKSLLEYSQHVLQPALRARGIDFQQRRRIRLRAGAGEEGARAR